MGTTKHPADDAPPAKPQPLSRQPWRGVPGKEGVVYREHPDRRNGRRPDRYIAIRYRGGQGKRALEALGWASEGWTAEKAVALLREIKENIRLGRRPQSLREMREMAEAARHEAERAAAVERLRRITFGELAEGYRVWAREHRVSHGGISQALDLHILPELGHRAAADITPADVEALRQRVAAKRPLSGRNKNNPGATLAPQTVLHVLKTVREVYNWALETPSPHDPGVMLHSGPNPAVLRRRGRGIRPPRSDARRLRVLNDAEIAALLSDGRVGGDLRDMILLSLDCGPRAGELVHLLRESCDPESGAIRIYKGSRANSGTKGGASRLVFAGQLVPQAREMLRRRLAEPASCPWLFPGRDGRARDAGSLSRAMRRIAARLGLNDGVDDPRNLVVWHTLRHTFATRMLESGVDIHTLKELLGHASVTTTEIYLHLCDRARREQSLARIALARRPVISWEPQSS